MCAIAGELTLDGAPPELLWLEQALAAMQFRGPDGQGCWSEPPISLGHRRLAMRGGPQPVHFQASGLRLVGNAELYGEGDEFERVQLLYRQKDSEYASRLVGMFALALWDERRKRLLLSRDRSGMKPLYYFEDGRRLVFASDLMALLLHPAAPRHLRKSSLHQYGRLGCVLDPDTMVEGIQQVPAGHTLEVGPHGHRLLPFSRAPKAGPIDLEKLMWENLRSTLESDHPLGVFLSGGLDSSSLAAGVRQLTGKVTTFSVTFAEKDWDEGAWSALVARHLDALHRPLQMTVERATQAAEALAEGLDQPLADPSALACWALARHAREHVKGVLTGDGGDELFAGYPWHRRQARFDGNLDRWLARVPSLRLFESSIWQELAGPPPHNLYAGLQLKLKGLPGWRAALEFDRATCLRSDMLVKVDRTTMLNSLEARLPWLNHPLMDAVDGWLRAHRLNKLALRQSWGRLLPAEIVHRPKKGFGVPLALWSWRPGPFRDLLYDTLSQPELRLANWLDQTIVRRLLRENERIPIHAGGLWGLFLLERWLRRAPLI